MTRKIVEAVRTAARDFNASSWTQPRQMDFHRDQITRALLSGATEYQHAFVYPAFDVDGYIKAISATAEMAKDILPEILREPVRHHLDSCAKRALALASGQDDRYEATAIDLDGLPDENIVANAWSTLTGVESPPVDSAGPITAEELSSRFETALNHYALTNWRVQISADMSARMSVNGPHRRIRVRSGANFSTIDADRLLIHEIGGHVLRWENAARQPEPLALLPLGSTVPTEEGLALWNETAAGLLDPRALRTYAARTLAVDMARTMGILPLAAALHHHLELSSAVEIAIRVKRGLRNPNNTGGLTKDWGYLGGLRFVTTLAQSDRAGLQILQGVKWSINHLPLAKELHSEGRLASPELLPEPTKLGISSTMLTAKAAPPGPAQ
ncbi:UNVERIFIED_ORG: hypothetical protein J2X79_003767 [Arthrobacter globiformis]|nr:hypothetical protein [Arthrobacter globiformis]